MKQVLALIAITLLLLVGSVISTSLGSRREKRQTTDKTVTAVAERLDAQVERGRYKRADPAAVTETDSWGRQVRVEYRDEGLAERLIVRSAGPDGSFETDDDISAFRVLMNAKGIGESLHDGSASVAKEVAKGLIKGVKEEVKDSFKRKTRADQPQ